MQNTEAESDDLMVHCATCSQPVGLRKAMVHLERCFNRVRSHTVRSSALDHGNRVIGYLHTHLQSNALNFTFTIKSFEFTIGIYMYNRISKPMLQIYNQMLQVHNEILQIYNRMVGIYNRIYNLMLQIYNHGMLGIYNGMLWSVTLSVIITFHLSAEVLLGGTGVFAHKFLTISIFRI